MFQSQPGGPPCFRYAAGNSYNIVCKGLPSIVLLQERIPPPPISDYNLLIDITILSCSYDNHAGKWIKTGVLPPNISWATHYSSSKNTQNNLTATRLAIHTVCQIIYHGHVYYHTHIRPCKTYRPQVPWLLTAPESCGQPQVSHEVSLMHIFSLPYCQCSVKISPSPIISHINEDRRKTEGQVQMFEFLKEIEECPVSCPVHHDIVSLIQ